MRQGLGQVTRAALFAGLFAVGACENQLPDPAVTVKDAYVRLSPLPGRPASAYFSLSSNNDPTRLVSVTSPAVERIELHGSMTMDGMAQMAPLTPDELNFVDGKLVFAPGGKHAMAFGVAPGLMHGARVPLTFTFAPAPPVTVKAQVRAFGSGE